MKAKLFKFLPIELKKSTANPNEFQLTQPVEIKAKDYLGNLSFKLPPFIENLLLKTIIIKSIIWRKPKQTTIETAIDLKPLFKKSEKYIKLENAKLVVSTDLEVVSVVE